MIETDVFMNEIQQKIPGVPVTGDAVTVGNYAVDGLLPRLVVEPESAEDAASVVALANQHDLALLARGGGSYMHLGAIPEPFDVLLKTDRLTRLREHEA